MKNLINILPIQKGGKDIEVPTIELESVKQFLDGFKIFYEEVALFPARLMKRRVSLFKKVEMIEGVGKMELLTIDDFESSDNIICVSSLSIANTKEELEERERLR